MTLLTFSHVSKSFGHGPTACRALCDISFTVAAGEMLAVSGPSGSGKSTLLHLAAGLDLPDTGHVTVSGRPISAESEAARALWRRRAIGYVYQSLNLLPAWTVFENIEAPLVLAGQSPPARRQRVMELLAEADLAEKALALPDQLSGGEQQRVAALRAVAHRPPLVLLDEPTSHLDSAAAARLLDLLTELNAMQGTTIVVTAHDPAIIAGFPRCIALHDGRIADDQGERP